MRINILHRISVTVLVWVLSFVLASGQNPYRVYRGSVHEYKVSKTAFAASYSWEVFSDENFSPLKVSNQVEMTSVGPGRENEVRVTWNVPGNYYLMVSVSSAEGCTNRMAWHFYVDTTDDKPIARINGPSTVFLGSCDVAGYSLDARTSTGGGLTFGWSPSAYIDDATSPTPRFLPGKTTRYHLTVTDDRGQKDTTSVMIIVENAPKAITDRNVFVSDPNKPILLNGTKSTGASLTYSWNTKEGTIRNGGTASTAEVSGLGTYYLKVTDKYGCFNIDSVKVGLYTQAVRDTGRTNINLAVDINVLANDIPKKELDPSTLRIVSPPSNGIATVVGDSLVSYLPNSYFVGSDDFTYTICDYFQHCDQATVLVLVNDHPFFIPEAFSPNGDGINDNFEIKGLAKYKSVEIEIFNRWGNVVYQSKNYGEGQGKAGFWDGTSGFGLRVGSGPVPSGTYFYVLRLDGKEKINGTIYLDR